MHTLYIPWNIEFSDLGAISESRSRSFATISRKCISDTIQPRGPKLHAFSMKKIDLPETRSRLRSHKSTFSTFFPYRRQVVRAQRGPKFKFAVGIESLALLAYVFQFYALSANRWYRDHLDPTRYAKDLKIFQNFRNLQNRRAGTSRLGEWISVT